MSDRALSTALSYVLLLGVTTVLITGISITASGLLETQQERTVEQELTVIGERVAADIMTADRLAQTDGTLENLTVTSEPPRSVSSGGYTVTVEASDPNTRLVLEDPNTEVTTETAVANVTPIEETRVRGGTIEITSEDGRLVITND